MEYRRGRITCSCSEKKTGKTKRSGPVLTLFFCRQRDLTRTRPLCSRQSFSEPFASPSISQQKTQEFQILESADTVIRLPDNDELERGPDVQSLAASAERRDKVIGQPVAICNL